MIRIFLFQQSHLFDTNYTMKLYLIQILKLTYEHN